jgi:hypothetical protein
MRESVMRFEAGVGGRFLEVYDEATEDHFEIGRVLVWEPASRLVFRWRGQSFEPGQTTEVDVRFEAVEAGTRIVLEHRGFEGLPADHPVRHGLEGPAFTQMIGLWWADLLVAARAHGAGRSGPA